MKPEMIQFIDTKSGETGEMLKRLWGKKPFMPADRIEVKTGTKPFVAALYKPQSPETFKKNHPAKVTKNEPADIVTEEATPVVETQPEEDKD